MENKKIVKENWVSQFNLVGEAKVNDYTFKIDEQSNSSNWIYNSMNLGVDCGENHGVVYCELMSGYSADGGSVIYAHAKDDDGKDDFETRITVDWDDRLNPEILENIGDLCCTVVGLEKTDKDKTFYKKFLSAYDAIAYAKEHLEDGMVVNVKGSIKYSMYNDNVQVHKTINSIVLSKVDDKSKYNARFTQSVLLDKDSASLKAENIDKDKGVMYVDTRVLDYVKEMNGKEIKGQYPFHKQFEFKMDFTKQEVCKKIMDKLFKVKKDITQITFEGEFIEGGATVTATIDDIPEDIKDLIDMGVYTEEEALARCSTNGNRVNRMVLLKPMIRLVGEDKIPVVQKFEQQYTEDDLVLDCMLNNEEDSDEETVSESDSSELSWLENL